jgi:hypothetical protein
MVPECPSWLRKSECTLTVEESLKKLRKKGQTCTSMAEGEAVGWRIELLESLQKVSFCSWKSLKDSTSSREIHQSSARFISCILKGSSSLPLFVAPPPEKCEKKHIAECTLLGLNTPATVASFAERRTQWAAEKSAIASAPKALAMLSHSRDLVSFGDRSGARAAQAAAVSVLVGNDAAARVYKRAKNEVMDLVDRAECSVAALRALEELCLADECSRCGVAVGSDEVSASFSRRPHRSVLLANRRGSPI